MSTENKAQDPMEFMRGMWSKMGFSIPGMVTPTLDIGELDKRITDMKAVENWLKMNLSSLQMAIQGFEMQRATLSAMQAMSKIVAEGGRPEAPPPPADNPFASPMWPWNMMPAGSEPTADKSAPSPAPASAKPKTSK